MIRIDINIPKNCEVCPCLHQGEYNAFEKSWCAIKSEIGISQKKRPKDCPIVLED